VRSSGNTNTGYVGNGTQSAIGTGGMSRY